MGFLETQCLNGIYGFQTGNSFVRVKFYFTWEESSRESNLNINGMNDKLLVVLIWITYLYIWEGLIVYIS